MPTLTGIHNENEFYSHHYPAEIFAGDIQATLERWREQAESAGRRTPWAELRALAADYLRFRGDFNRERRPGQRIFRQHEWFRALLAALGYRWQPANLALEDGAEVPILCADGAHAGAFSRGARGACRRNKVPEAGVCAAPHPSDALATAYFVPQRDLGQYADEEKVQARDENGRLKLRVHKRGTFIYRLAGRDRQKSASYYTPESLTRTLVQHTLAELVTDAAPADDI